MEIKLGGKVKDSISKIEGIATARTVYLYGCEQICVEFVDKKSGELKEMWLDEQRLNSKSKVKAGGVYSPPPSRSNAKR